MSEVANKIAGYRKLYKIPYTRNKAERRMFDKVTYNSHLFFSC